MYISSTIAGEIQRWLASQLDAKQPLCGGAAKKPGIWTPRLSCEKSYPAGILKLPRIEQARPRSLEAEGTAMELLIYSDPRR